MEQIRRRARAGLMAAPRVGMAVGGLLMGVREASNGGPRIRILDSVDLPCSHSTGPSFTLTPDEKKESAAMVAEANALSATSKVSVVGWYCSKTRGDAVLSESDRSFFAELLPGAGRIALVLRPDVFDAMRAVFHFRDEHGTVVKGLECEVDEWRAPAPPSSDPEDETSAPAPANPPPESPKVVEIRPSVLKSAEAKGTEASPAPVTAKTAAAAAPDTSLEAIISLSENSLPESAPAAPLSALRSPMFGQPAFPLPPPQRASRLPLILTAAILLVGLAAGAFFTRDSWYPRPPLTLTVDDDNGTLMIHWDPNSVRGIDHASMYVNDGGQPTPSLIPLDSLELKAGLYSYTPKSKRVTAKLDIGSTSAFSSWIAPEPAKADPPPADGAQAPVTPAAPRSTEPRP